MTQPEVNSDTPANSGATPVNMFTQEQVNHFAAEAKRGALNTFFKDLGFDKPPTGDELKNTLSAAAEYSKLQDGQKGDVERLTTDLAAKTAEADRVPGLQSELLRARLAGDAGLKSRYWRYVEGDDEAAINASIREVLADVPGGGGEGESSETSDQPPAKTGTGKLEPNPQQGTAGGGKPKPSMQAGRDAYKARIGT